MPRPPDRSEPTAPRPRIELEPRILEPKEFVEEVTEEKVAADRE